MVDMDAPLDFELEDPLLSSPVVSKKRKKVIGLDDLLTDYYKEKNKLVEKETKQKRPRKDYNSDEDENGKEALLSKYVNDCQNQMNEISGEEEISEWGIPVFGTQKTPPPLDFLELESCSLLQSFMNNEVNSLAEFTVEKGDTFLEGLLVNGWLSKLAFTCGHVEKHIATWTFNLMLYSSKEELGASACDFWCAILSSKNEVGVLPIKIDWFPSYSELKRALVIYGFSFIFPSNAESVNTDSGCRGPPQSIRAWIKFTVACFQVRSKRSIFLTSEVEELVEIITCLFLDRQLQGLSVLFYECMQSVIGCFTDQEWNTSCEKIAKSLACRVPRDLNCLRAVECISAVNDRSKHLRSAVARQIIVLCFDNKVTDEEGILSLLISINVKDRDCDLFKMYIYLILMENWLLSNPMLEGKPLINEMWSLYLRNCSCQISSTDLRPYASKVRNKAAYLLQGTVNK